MICGVLELANDGAHAHGFHSRGQISPVMSGTKDARTVHGYCAGTGLPGSICCYTACAIWRAQREAEWAARRGPDALRDEQAVRAPRLDQDLAAALRVGSHLTDDERQEILAMRG